MIHWKCTEEASLGSSNNPLVFILRIVYNGKPDVITPPPSAGEMAMEQGRPRLVVCHDEVFNRQWLWMKKI
ncbi:MAG: hypothetical protein LBB24_03750 [Rickettsiales bacterium]|jgi:hypothetical protein|nr:hypothetical protein [Rickettsiales bacterium]